MTAKRVVVSIADESVPQIKLVARKLKSAGLEVDQVMATLGLITGKVAGDKLAPLRQVPGVAAVEEEQQIHLAPPDAEAQ